MILKSVFIVNEKRRWKLMLLAIENMGLSEFAARSIYSLPLKFYNTETIKLT